MSNSSSSSPLLLLSQAQLTPSGLLLLDRNDGEVEIVRKDGVELRITSNEEDEDRRESDLCVTLTTHRLVLSSHNIQQQEARFLHLSNIHTISSVGGEMRVFGYGASSKIQICTYSLPGDLFLVFRNNKSDRDDMLQHFEKCLERRAWEMAAKLQQKKQQTSLTRRVGVDAILTKSKYQHQQAAKLTDQAFDGDAETLLREASELVSIIHKYSRTLEQKNNETGGDNEDSSDATRLSDMMQDMGMTSALSRAGTTNAAYYETLARQLSDFLRPKLSKAGGCMTLTDVYCLFNRARATNLISPQDLCKAVELMGELHVGMSLREFTSGVKVVQSDSFDAYQMAQKLQQLAETNTTLTALSVSRELHISALLAHEQLVAAEQLGYLCRDVTLESTKFYLNRFPEFRSM